MFLVVIFRFYSCMAHHRCFFFCSQFSHSLSVCLCTPVLISHFCSFLFSFSLHWMLMALALPHFTLVTLPITYVPPVTGELHARFGAHSDPLSVRSLCERVSAAGSSSCMEEGKACSTIPRSQIPINH